LHFLSNPSPDENRLIEFQAHRADDFELLLGVDHQVLALFEIVSRTHVELFFTAKSREQQSWEDLTLIE